MFAVKNTFVTIAEAAPVLRRTKSCIALRTAEPVVEVDERSSVRSLPANFRVSDLVKVEERASSVSTNDGETRTTLILRNIPRTMKQMELLNKFSSFKYQVDFFYLPTDFANGCNLGYAFVNLATPTDAAAFADQFEGLVLGANRTRKNLTVEYARMQGLNRNVQHFRNSHVMRENEAVHPMIFVDGERVAFPQPNKGKTARRTRRC